MIATGCIFSLPGANILRNRVQKKRGQVMGFFRAEIGWHLFQKIYSCCLSWVFLIVGNKIKKNRQINPVQGEFRVFFRKCLIF